MSSIRDPRKFSKSYIEQREARRAGREKKPLSEFEKDVLSNIERDIRADIERHVRSLEDQEQGKTTSKAEQRRSWWRFWKRRKRSEDW